MVKKASKPKKAILKRGVNAVKLVEELLKLQEEGQEMLAQPIIDEKKFDVWYNKVLFHLQASFTKPDNEYTNRFVGPPPLPLFSNDGIPTYQSELQFELNSELGDKITNLNIIISDIQVHFCY